MNYFEQRLIEFKMYVDLYVLRNNAVKYESYSTSIIYGLYYVLVFIF
jgi:hypothetical protein